MARLELVLLRHGEAENPDVHSGRRDRERALTSRGIAQASRCGKLWAAGSLSVAPAPFKLMIASDARRARETAAAVGAALAAAGFPLERREDARLYLAGLTEIGAVLATCDAAVTPAVILVGHNPGFSDAAMTLSNDAVELSTAEAAHLTIEADTWIEALCMTGDWQLQIMRA